VEKTETEDVLKDVSEREGRHKGEEERDVTIKISVDRLGRRGSPEKVEKVERGRE